MHAAFSRRLPRSPRSSAFLAPTGSAAAQSVEAGTDTVVPRPDPGDVRGVAQAAQARFELRRVRHLPRALDGSHGPCDEIVGRFCTWYDEGEWSPEPEDPEIGRMRAALLAELDSLQPLAPRRRQDSVRRGPPSTGGCRRTRIGRAPGAKTTEPSAPFPSFLPTHTMDVGFVKSRVSPVPCSSRIAFWTAVCWRLTDLSCHAYRHGSRHEKRAGVCPELVQQASPYTDSGGLTRKTPSRKSNWRGPLRTQGYSGGKLG